MEERFQVQCKIFSIMQPKGQGQPSFFPGLKLNVQWRFFLYKCHKKEQKLTWLILKCIVTSWLWWPSESRIEQTIDWSKQTFHASVTLSAYSIIVCCDVIWNLAIHLLLSKSIIEITGGLLRSTIWVTLRSPQTSSCLFSFGYNRFFYSNASRNSPKISLYSVAHSCRDIDWPWRENCPVVNAPPVRLSLRVIMMQKAGEV